jgi:hypothetical protein
MAVSALPTVSAAAHCASGLEATDIEPSSSRAAEAQAKDERNGHRARGHRRKEWELRLSSFSEYPRELLS